MYLIKQFMNHVNVNHHNFAEYCTSVPSQLKYFASFVPSMIVTISGVLANALCHADVFQYDAGVKSLDKPFLSIVVPLTPALVTKAEEPNRSCK